jgi:hypothetical protein
MPKYWDPEKFLAIHIRCEAKKAGGDPCLNPTSQADKSLLKQTTKVLTLLDICKTGVDDFVWEQLKEYSEKSLCLRDHRNDPKCVIRRAKKFRAAVEVYIEKERQESLASDTEIGSSGCDSESSEEDFVEIDKSQFRERKVSC